MEITSTIAIPAFSPVAAARQKAKAAKFRPSAIFGPMLYERTVGSLVVKFNAWRERRFVDGKRENPWGIWDTPLPRFTYTQEYDVNRILDIYLQTHEKLVFSEIIIGLVIAPKDMPDFEKFVHSCADKAIAASGECRVLIVGGCSGEELKPLMERSGVKMNFTVLTMGLVKPEMRKFAYECSAGDLHKVFPENYFDIVVSHYSIYGQRKIGLANMLHVAKPGGNVIVAGRYIHSSPTGILNKGNGREFGVVSFEPSDDYNSYFFHLKKN